MKPLRSLLVAGAFAFSAHLHAVLPGTAFTYQGRLNEGGTPANGSFDFRFTVYNQADTVGTVGTPSPCRRWTSATACSP